MTRSNLLLATLLLVAQCFPIGGQAAFAQSPRAAVARPVPRASPDQATTQNQGLREVGRTGDTGAGRVGRRQDAQDTEKLFEPLARLSNRVANRVQSRIRNRIDQYYDPTANATSPFELATERSRSTNRRPQ